MAANPNQPPSFRGRAIFHVRTNRYYRVCILPDELLFLDAGTDADNVMMGAAAAGGLVGVLVASLFVSRGAKARVTRQEELDTADVEKLIELAMEGPHSFRAGAAELTDVSIGRKSLWYKLNFPNAQAVGLFHFRHPVSGDRVVMEFLDVEEMKLAIELLPKVLKAEVAVDVEWDEERRRFVAAR